MNNRPRNPNPTIDDSASEKLAIHVYEYLVHVGASRTARMFLEEIRWNRDHAIPITEPPGFLFSWWSVFWDLYSAAPERRNHMKHSNEAKAFCDYYQLGSLPPGHPHHTALMSQQQTQHLLIKEQQQRYQQYMLAMKQRQIPNGFPDSQQQPIAQLQQMQPQPRMMGRPIRPPLHPQQQLDQQMLHEAQQQMFLSRALQNQKRTSGSNWEPGMVDPRQMELFMMEHQQQQQQQQQQGGQVPNVTITGKMMDPIFPNSEQFDDRQLESMMRDIIDGPQQHQQFPANVAYEFSPNNMHPTVSGTGPEPTLGSQNSCSSACSTSSSAGSFPSQLAGQHNGPFTPGNRRTGGYDMPTPPEFHPTGSSQPPELNQEANAQFDPNLNFSDSNSASTPIQFNCSASAVEQDFKISPIWKSNNGGSVGMEATQSGIKVPTESMKGAQNVQQQQQQQQ